MQNYKFIKLWAILLLIATNYPFQSLSKPLIAESLEIQAAIKKKKAVKLKSKNIINNENRKITKPFLNDNITPTNIYQVTHSGVGTSCFPKKLLAILQSVKNKYDTKPIISSGFRSKIYNKRVGGAKHSYHIKCQAADIEIPGVSKYELGKYLKTLPNVGGVGIYECSKPVHVDIGPRRNWHWGCPRRLKKIKVAAD